MRGFLLILIVGSAWVFTTAQNPAPPANQPAPRSDSASEAQQPPRSDSRPQQSEQEQKLPGDDSALPVNQGESSSRSSIIDLSPPKSDDLKHLGSDDAVESAGSDVGEFKPWNPHKAQKDIEVGDFYAKQKNYRAAISRYREALEYKPKDALATFKLAEGLEKVNAFQEARENYEAYLIILPRGPLAEKARQGIDRLKDKSRPRPRLNQDGTTTNPTSQSSQSPR